MRLPLLLLLWLVRATSFHPARHVPDGGRRTRRPPCLRESLLETFERTSPWMSPSPPPDSIPGFLTALDISKYVDIATLNEQPIIVRMGLGLLIIDIIPLAIDVLVFKWLLKKFVGIGSDDDDVTGGAASQLLTSEELNLEGILVSSELISFLDSKKQAAVSSRSKALISAFYSDFFGKGFQSGLPPDCLLFKLFMSLGTSFEAVALSLVDDKLVSSKEVCDFVREESKQSMRSVEDALRFLKQSKALAVKGLDSSSVEVLALSPLGTIYSAGLLLSSSGPKKVVVGVRGKSRKTSSDDSFEAGALLDLYIIRKILQAFQSYPATARKAELVLPLIDRLMDQALQLNRIFGTGESAGGGGEGDDIMFIPYASIYS